jgi:aspartyl-tRNA(Asn)/glutamyl-tRNA(Gln) amidotransferase subunit A
VESLQTSFGSTPKIAFLPSFDYSEVDENISTEVRFAVRKLERHFQVKFHETSQLGFQDPSRAADVHWLSLYSSLHKDLERRFSKLNPDWEQLLDPSLLLIMNEGKKLSRALQEESLNTRKRIADYLDSFFEEHDFLITPATPCLPWEAGKPRPDRFRDKARSAHTPFTYVFNYARLPSITIPCGIATVPGEDPNYPVPVGLQIVASKKTPIQNLLKLAHLAESLFCYFKRPRWDGLSLLNAARVEIVLFHHFEFQRLNSFRSLH